MENLMMAQKIDHTLLKADATKADIVALADEAAANHFYSVCIQPSWVKLAAEHLRGTDVHICTVVGFPLGANTSETKAFETTQAISQGATEIDMVLPIGALLDGDTETVQHDIEAVVKAAGDIPVKVILETCLLTDEQITTACKLAIAAKAAFVKTSTGFSTGGATLDDVALMSSVVKGHCQVKASGGIRDRQTAEAMIEAGADRIGASASVTIVNMG
ncbi:deoxyribose-phosphate aldolase [Aureibacillus halotolerans]|uniref:Deoxyribose-phosphate aldolase n=1 Tax=Aureibacillus halotolerans TaxID=1508390 RepID=A0A4R6U4V3_9BACI|nr:deoxyribose-phosphate aldolase [Aureibacillus halotolerans]TDQ38054.1 deoxyribose-phosphate aldolase [Aureibacillus halotolerans]